MMAVIAASKNVMNFPLAVEKPRARLDGGHCVLAEEVRDAIFDRRHGFDNNWQIRFLVWVVAPSLFRV